MGKLSIAKATKALQAHRGVVLYAAQACGCTRQTFHRFMQQHPELEEVRDEAAEELLDISEGHMIGSIEAGNMKTVLWHLERRGKNRGYNTRVENTGADGGPLEFGTVERRIVDPENSDE